MARKPHLNGDAEGLYQRGDRWWLGYTYAGKRIRINLRTKDIAVAVERAKPLRSKPPKGQERIAWEVAIEKYLAEKQQKRRPPGYVGRWQQMRPGTIMRVRSCLNVFSRWSETASPDEISIQHLDDYLEYRTNKPAPGARHRGSNAGARSTLAQIQGFLHHIGNLPERVQLPDRKDLERREIVLTLGEANKLITAVDSYVPTGRRLPPERLKRYRRALEFILYMGFHVGLRKGEIMHATPEWFDLPRAAISVPRVDEIGTNTFRIKDNEGRVIPLSDDVTEFMVMFLRDCPRQEYCLQNATKRRSAAGTFDFRMPFKTFMVAQGFPKFFPHAMRHTYITELCHTEGMTIQNVAAWSGDEIRTIEKHYWHKRIEPQARKALNDAFSMNRRKTPPAPLISDLPAPKRLDEYSDPHSAHFISAD